MDFNTLLQAFGGTAGLVLAGAIAYHFYQKTKEDLPIALKEIRELKDSQKNTNHELEKTKIELNHVKEELYDLKKSEETHYNENKKKNEINWEALQELKVSLAKLDTVPTILDKILSKLNS